MRSRTRAGFADGGSALTTTSWGTRRSARTSTPGRCCSRTPCSPCRPLPRTAPAWCLTWSTGSLSSDTRNQLLLPLPTSLHNFNWVSICSRTKPVLLKSNHNQYSHPYRCMIFKIKNIFNISQWSLNSKRWQVIFTFMLSYQTVF